MMNIDTATQDLNQTQLIDAQELVERMHYACAESALGIGISIVLPHLMTPFVRNLHSPNIANDFPAKGKVPVVHLAASQDAIELFKEGSPAKARSTGLLIHQQLPLLLHTVWLGEKAFTFGFDAAQPTIIKALRSWARLGFIPVLQSGLSSFAVGRFPFQPTKEVASFLRWAEKSPRLFSMDRWNLHKAGLKIAHEIPELAIGGIVQPAFSIDNLVEMTRWVASENEFVMN